MINQQMGKTMTINPTLTLKTKNKQFKKTISINYTFLSVNKLVNQARIIYLNIVLYNFDIQILPRLRVLPAQL